MKGSSSNNVQQMQNQQSQDSGCKIFVGGLTWNTTKEMLHNEFSKYGEIVDSIVMKNPETGNSRGFGFVTYKENMSAEAAVAAGSNKVDGKIVDVKLCNPRLAAQQRNIKQRIDNCKVFVGGLPHGVTDDQIKQFFTRYGSVKEFKMMYDENKQRPRGFGFITFDSEESANQVLQEHYIQFNGKQIEVKPQIHNIRQQLPYQPHQQPMSTMHFQQQGHFSGGNQSNWGSQWNQNQQPQIIPNSIYPSMMQQQQSGFNQPLGNQQQWGSYQGGHGSQQMASYVNPNDAGSQSNWNYQYYGQQPYYQQPAEITGTDSPLQHQHQQQQQQQPYQSHLTEAFQQPLNIKPQTTTSVNLTSNYLQDTDFLSHHQTRQKNSSSSSIAGTIGSSNLTNYADSETSSSRSYYRANSIGSNSSIAPSVNSITSCSATSNLSGNSADISNSSIHSFGASSGSNLSNQNHHRINTQSHMMGLMGRGERHGRYGGSVASSSAVSDDVMSQNGSVMSQMNVSDDRFYGVDVSSGGQRDHRQATAYHPYRR